MTRDGYTSLQTDWCLSLSWYVVESSRILKHNYKGDKLIVEKPVLKDFRYGESKATDIEEIKEDVYGYWYIIRSNNELIATAST